MMVIFAVFESPIMRQLLFALVLALSASACGTAEPPSLALGSPAPDFALPGVDGRIHSLRDYADSRVLAVVFTCNTCPASQLYEARIGKLHDEYRGKGVTVVAINPNKPGAMQLADLRYTDVGETLDDMKVRAAHRHIQYPYLSDGETQAVSKTFGVATTPHIFVFDQARTLQYQGRIDDDPREERVRSHDARTAIDALLAGRPVSAARTRVAGCPVKGLSGPSGPDEQLARFEKEPVALEMVGADDLKRLRQNGTGKLLMINFWATWCAPCASEFPDLEATYRIYEPRNLDFVTVSVNDPEERAAVLQFLQSHHSSHRNVQFARSDVYGLQAAFDPKMPAPVPFTLLLAPNGDVVYQELGELDVTKLRRAILANLPDDAKYRGQQAYWSKP
jgi:thiol-disulfide isomerase/thioredoxin